MENIANRPGIKTTEFWLAIIVILFDNLITFGVIPTGSIWEKLILVVVATIVAIGYGTSRTLVKIKK